MKTIINFLMKIHLKMLASSEASKKSGIFAIEILFIGLPVVAIAVGGTYFMLAPFLKF